MARKARKDRIQQVLIKSLAEKWEAGCDRSKYLDKQETSRLRKEARARGLTYKETLYIDASKNYIYSESTFKNYKKHVKYFCRYLEEEHGLKKISMEEAKEYIQSYVHYLDDKGWSPYSINLSLSAVVKATGGYLTDYEHPRRHIAEITRSSGEAVHDKKNEGLFSYQANKILGMRRNELLHLRVEDISVVERDGREYAEVIVKKGKGGKMRTLEFYDDEKDFVLGLKKGKGDKDKVFDSDEIKKNDADYHGERHQRAKELYERIVEEMQSDPDKKKWYQDQIREAFARAGKRVKEDLDHPIYARGSHRKALEDRGIDVKLDRTATMYVSLFLGHNRTDVTAEHYIQK